MIENQTTRLILGLIVAIVVTVGTITGFFAFKNFSTPKAKIGNQEFNLILSKSEEERQIGLSRYESLARDKGMLFIFDKADYYRFWMKDMKFPIDIIFIKEDKISKIIKNAPVPKDNSALSVYFSEEPIDKVLEINAGLSDKYNFRKGDKVELQNVK